jgi:N-acyl-D-amino-acid deacylase
MLGIPARSFSHSTRTRAQRKNLRMTGYRLISLLLITAPLAGWAVSEVSFQAASTHYDLLLSGGKVLDGTGNPWFSADVGVTGGRVAAVGDLRGATASRRVDVSGLFVVPGFVDMHSHAADVASRTRGFDSSDPRDRAAPNLVAQGITTVAVNQDGRSPLDLARQRARYDSAGVGLNAVLMVGHGSVRRAVMGDDHKRVASAPEIQEMQALVRRAMEAGAAGLSAGLEYAPGRWAATSELVALVREVAAFDGVYISHQRSEGADPMWFWPSVDSAGPPTLTDAILETIEIGERTGGRVVASHIKAKGAHYWGSSAAAIQLIQAARDRGVQVWADQYPYTTSGSDGNTVLLPPWAFSGVNRRDELPDYAGRVRSLLAEPVRAAALRRDIAHEIRRRGGAPKVLIMEAADSAHVGLTLAELGRRLDLDPVEAAIWIQLNGLPGRRGGARIRGFSMDASDADRYAALPWVATASDAGIAVASDGPVHPRFWGTFPRKIRRYALERGVMSVADAIRSMTSLPAQLLGLGDRGLVRAGFVADLTVIDLEEIRDHATAFEPHAEPEGVVYVFLAGEAILQEGVRTGELSGAVIQPTSFVGC